MHIFLRESYPLNRKIDFKNEIKFHPKNGRNFGWTYLNKWWGFRNISHIIFLYLYWLLTNFSNYIKCFQIHITLKSSPIQYYCFVCWSPRAGSGRVPRKATDFARDLQLVHHHFCILQKECGKLEGTKTKTNISTTTFLVQFSLYLLGPWYLDPLIIGAYD